MSFVVEDSATAQEVSGRRDTWPPSSSQEQMWLLNQVAQTSQAYLMTWTYRLRGRLDVEALFAAWSRIVERHEVLRTRYRQEDAALHQIVDPPGPVDCRLISPTDETAATREQRALQIAAWERRRPFDLADHWPIRITIIEAGVRTHLMVVAIHHIACDDVTFQIIAKELDSFYAESVTGQPADCPRPRIQYGEYAAREKERLSRDALTRHLDYWRTTLRDVPELMLPQRGGLADESPSAGTVELDIRPDTATAVYALAAANRASPFMVLLAAYHVWLSRISGQDDVTVGFPVSLRTPDLDDLLGNLVNTVVSRTRHHPGECFVDVLAQVRIQVLDAMDHRFAPFARVVDEVNPARGRTANPLFRVAFDMEHTSQSIGIRLAGLQVERVGALVAPEPKFDLTLHVAENADQRLAAQFEFAGSLIGQDKARTWAVQAASMLHTLVSDPHAPIPFSTVLRANPVQDGSSCSDDQVGASRREASADTLAYVRTLWTELLENPEIGLHDNFFDVGGDSLRAVAVAGRLRADGHDVSATDIFAHQTVAELAALCTSSQASLASDTHRRPPVTPFELLTPEDRAEIPADALDAYPLAAMQLGMIIELRNRHDVRAYQDSTSYLIRGDVPLNWNTLQEAAQLVVDRHEVLRTSFDLSSYSVPLQVVHRSAPITVGLTEHGTLGSAGWQPRLEAHAVVERSSPIDMTRPPLIRVHAHTAADTNNWCITITEFHPILEGWSFHTVLMEILDGYHALLQGGAPAAPEPVAFRYADYIAAEAAARDSAESREFWHRMVEGRKAVSVPVAWQGDRNQPRERYQYTMDYKELVPDLRRLAAETHTSLKSVLLAGHLKVMSMLAGTEDFYSGLVCDARPEIAGAEQVVGMYLNTLPFAMPAGMGTWGELVTAVYDGLTDLWPHRVYPMQLIQNEVGRGGRLLEVFFNYLDFHHVDWDLVDNQVAFNDNENEFALHIPSFIGALRINTTSHRLSRPAAVRLAALYRRVFEEMSLGPEGRADRSYLPGQDRELLRALDRSSEDGPAPAPLLESISRHAQSDPDKTAVRCGSDALTYAQLIVAVESVATDSPPGRGTDAVIHALSAVREDDAGHGELVRALKRLTEELRVHGGGIGKESTWLCVSPLSSMRGMMELLIPLTTGGTAIVTAATLPESVSEIGGLIAAGNVTHAQLTEPVAERVLGSDPRSKIAVIDPVYVDEVGPVSLNGSPLSGLSVHVIDDRGRPLPAGVVGELSVGDLESGNLSRSGLAARVGVDGRLQVLRQLRLNRTEELLMLDDTVRDCRVVEVLDTTTHASRLVGFVRLEASSEIGVDEIRGALADRRIPRSFIPDDLVPVDEWPLTAHGDVDLEALSKSLEPRQPSAEHSATPWDERFEKILLNALESMGEGAKSILDPDLPLADLGMNSMAIIKAVVAIEQVYEINFPDDFQIVDLFRTPRKLWSQVCDLLAADELGNNG